ncbi:MAG: HK97 gp10 family phage protein [Clostridia bacterium]|nr:HK97 gp10 family phage protein [Clostridia bacterium]
MSSKADFEALRKRIISAAERGMEKAVTKLQADTQMLTHVDTGALRRSWTHSVTTTSNDIVGTVGSNLKYAPYEDALHPNLSEALESNVDKYFNLIRKELKNA